MNESGKPLIKAEQRRRQKWSEGKGIQKWGIRDST